MGFLITLGLALGGGMLGGLAFPHWNLWFLLFPALMCLFGAVRRCADWRHPSWGRLVIGSVWGVAFFALHLTWLTIPAASPVPRPVPRGRRGGPGGGRGSVGSASPGFVAAASAVGTGGVGRGGTVAFPGSMGWFSVVKIGFRDGGFPADSVGSVGWLGGGGCGGGGRFIRCHRVFPAW